MATRKSVVALPKPAAKEVSPLQAADRLMKRATPKKSSKELRVLICPEPLRPAMSELCRWGYIQETAKKVAENEKPPIQEELCLRWTKEYVDEQKRPENFRMQVPRAEDGPDEAVCEFQLKVRTDGLQKDLNGFPADRDGDFAQHVASQLAGLGLSLKKAREFVANELKIYTAYKLAKSFDELYEEGPDAPLGRIARKMLGAITPEELAMVVEKKPTVEIKEGVAERLLAYCDNPGGMAELLKYIKVTLQVAKFDYLMSEDSKARMAAIGEVIADCVLPE